MPSTVDFSHKAEGVTCHLLNTRSSFALSTGHVHVLVVLDPVQHTSCESVTRSCAALRSDSSCRVPGGVEPLM